MVPAYKGDNNMNDEKRNRIIIWSMVLLFGVLPLVYGFLTATPDIQAEVVGVVIFIVIGLVAFVQISSRSDR